MRLFGDGLDAAVQKAFTHPVPKSAGAQMRYLVKQMKGTEPVAQMLRIYQRTVERYVKDQIKKPPDLAARLDRGCCICRRVILEHGRARGSDPPPMPDGITTTGLKVMNRCEAQGGWGKLWPGADEGRP